MTDLKPADALKQHASWTAGAPAGEDRSIMLDAHKGWRSRGYLPHCDGGGLIQHIVFGLADSLPSGVTPPSVQHGDHLLDAGHGTCLLRHAECASIVQDTLLRGDASDYRLLAWCIMPNHVHVVAEQNVGVRLDTVVQTWKSVAAHKINRHLDRRGRLWRREYFDKFMRDNHHLSTTIAYVEDNPVRAKLVANSQDWQWSSASARRSTSAGEGAGGPRKA